MVMKKCYIIYSCFKEALDIHRIVQTGAFIHYIEVMEVGKPGIIITVGGVPWDNLTDDHKRKIIKRNTDITSEIVTREVIKMAESGSTVEEIRKFLRLDKEVN